MSFPNLNHRPLAGTSRSAATTSGSNLGRLGQNPVLPNAKRIDGNSVSAASIANTMPIEASGPRELFDFRSLNSRQSNPAITVLPDATIGSKEPRMARMLAAHLSRSIRNSTR